ncbi:hypothetical protein KDL44_04850 [bacterium]|nr:hypothetical protein [bacterium]
MLGNSRSLLHLGGELLIMGAGAWGLYLRLVLGGSPVPTTSWFGPLGLLACGLLLSVLPLAPERNAAWIHDWIRPRLGLGSLFWSFAVSGCLYSLWLQYQLEFGTRSLWLLSPALLYWWFVSCPGQRIQQRNIDNAAQQPVAETVDEEVQHA